ncbi:ABC transporter ATP-binding protein [Rhodobacter sp. SGA-6-6]|uniref:ABC transporter ATP-binding protein n=1 Tax=Rhodobacter sp. SGA-6-6 TaxID=2710882 RepID=UPI001980FCD1|nr:ABC transporter ATP-binding protein [Rhodobacter sp. SGA-6-6]
MVRRGHGHSGIGIGGEGKPRRPSAPVPAAGLRQRALIASAIVASPQLLIADEPTTALDVNIQARIIDLLQELKQAGMGLLFVSHDLAVVSTVADHVVVMNEGRAVEQGPTAQVLEDPAHSYTRMLIAAMPSRAPVGARLSSVDLPPGSAFRSSRVRSEGDAPALSARGLHKS